jgi:large subunit ribosomal protein L32
LTRFHFSEPLTILATQTDAFPVNRSKQPFSLKDLIGDGFLFAVPTFRRTLEVRKTRKIGTPYRGGPEGLKTLQKKYNIRVCDTCHNYYERDCLCPNCYERVRLETKEIQDQIIKKLKLDPIEKDVVVLYDGEKEQTQSEFWNGKRIIEMEKPRPQWFSKNLMQKTTQPNAESSEIEVVGPTIQVKPSDLG